MDERAPAGPRRRTRLLGTALITALLGGTLVAGSSAPQVGAAPTPVVSVTPATGANASGQALQVSGSNVSTTANMGFGIYVSFGPNPDTLPSDWSTNSGYYQATAWTHAAGTGTTTNKKLESDGTFSYTLTRADGSPITAVYTASEGTFDCTQIECGILTLTAHGVPDRTQDTFTPVSFAPEVATTTLPFTNRTQAYSQTLAVDGGTAPYTWSLDSGTLPAGLSLSSAGVLSGSTTAAVTGGTYEFTVEVTDSSSSPLSATEELSLQVRTPTVTVVPSAGADPEGQTFTVSGSGFNPNAPVPGGPTGTGSYVAFGPNPALLPASPAYFASTSYYQAAIWARLIPPAVGDGQKPMNADGTFSFSFTTDGNPRALTAVYTTSTGTYDCKVIQCGISTFRSQGNADRSQDTFTPVAFGPAVTTTTLPFTNRTQAYSQALTAAGGTGPYTWSIESGTLPAGLALSSAGVLSGSTTASVAGGTYDFTVEVTDSSSPPLTASRELSLEVRTPTVTVVPVTGASPVGQTFTVTGSGFNPNAPVPGGPTGTGSYVAFGPDPALLPASPAYFASTSYYQAAIWARLNPPAVGDGQKPMNADGTFSFTFTTDGNPRALTAVYTTSTGTYDCTQIQCGISTFRSQGNADRSQDTFTPVVFGPGVTTTSLPFTNRTQAYSQTLGAIGGTGPYTWSIASGTLPAGLGLSSAGVLSGSTTAAVAGGTYDFTVEVTDSSSPPQSATKQLSLVVRTPTVTVVPATGANPDGQTFTVTGSGFNPNAPVPGGPTGTGSYVAFGPDPALLPASPAYFASTSYYQAAIWARLNPPAVGDGQKPMNADGTFSFTFTTEGDQRGLTAVYTTSTGTYDCTQIQCGIVTFRSQGNADRSQDTFTPVTFTVAPTPDPANTKVGVPYNTTVAAPFAGVAPYHWAVKKGALPPGLHVDPSTGQVTGTPTAVGNFKVVIRVTDSKAPKAKGKNVALKIRVAPVAITIAPASLPNASKGVAYMQTITASGSVAPYKFKRVSGTLPPNIKLKPAGILSGKSKKPGTYTFTVQVTDKFKFTATRTYTVQVTP